MPRELAAVVVGDGAACSGRRSAQLRDDGFGGEVGVFAENTPGQRQPALPLLKRQKNVALAAKVHQVALPMAELTAKMGLCRPLVDRRAVGEGGLAPAVSPPPAALGLALREQARQPRLSPDQAVGVAVDGLRADRVFGSFYLVACEERLAFMRPGFGAWVAAA